MDNIEEVKKILQNWDIGSTSIDIPAHQICQLFEPKPDESRLLTDEIRDIARSMITASHYNNLPDSELDNYLSSIIAKTASILKAQEQAIVRANLTLLVAEIQDCKDMVAVNQLLDCWIKANNLKPEEVETYNSLDELRQAFWKQELE